MEKNLTRKTLSFSKGITNIPSDLLSDDSELLECDGFIYKDGEMKPIQEPKLITSIPYELKYVHKGADFKNLIAYDEKKKTLYCYLYGENGIGETSDIQSFKIDELLDVNSIGNTLVCATSSGLHYLLLKGGRYKDLGTELPIPSVDFYLTPDYIITNKSESVCNLGDFLEVERYHAEYDKNTGEFKAEAAGDCDPLLLASGGYSNFWKPYLKEDEEKKQSYKDAITGHVSKQINYCKKKGYFVHPFFVRYALKMYDGTYARISAPIMCYPCTTKNNRFVPVKSNGTTYSLSTESCIFIMYPVYCKLYYYAKISGITDWTDIIKELVIFASDDVMPYRLEDGWNITMPSESNNTAFWDAPYNGYVLADQAKYHWTNVRGGDQALCVIVPTYKSEDEIIKELKSKSQFYKLFSIKVTDASKLDGVYKADITENVVNNLTTQEQLGKDDYYGWTSINAKKLYSYNKRLNTFDLERKPFEGFNCFWNKGLSEDNPSKYSFTFYVHISASGMDAWVKSNFKYCGSDAFADGWFFYPDPNATEVIVWDNNNSKGMLLQLETHPLLNGSYCFNKLPLKATLVTDDSITKPTIDSDAKEILNSQIYTSVVNNPFVFEASGDNTVGTGKIIGIVANTEAVSQGQFGQYPLMVFTDEGVYGMSVNSEGLYNSVYPISRDVCLENSPLVPTDKLIYFASNKGLMAASGGATACMSDLLRGRVPRNFATFGEGRFLDFMKSCKIAYDYKDSILRIFSEDKDYQYIYNMNDKTFFMVNSGMKIKSVLNDYPDNLIQDTGGKVYSLIEKPDINDDEKVYAGSFVTRPLKMGGSITLKSLRAIKHLVDTNDGTIGLKIWGSNDCKHWCQLHSMAGKPWKYFTFHYTLQGFKAIDSFAGSIVEIQSRREDKIR